MLSSSTPLRVLFVLAALCGALKAQAPIADFLGTPTSGFAPLNVTFTDLSTTNAPGSITSWAWDFDGDSIVDSTVQNPSFSYSVPGSYDVGLTVSDSFGGMDTKTKPRYITSNPPLLPSFTFSPESGCETTVTFTDTTAGSPMALQWDHGMGPWPPPPHSTAPGSHTHNYPVPTVKTTYQVRLRVAPGPAGSPWTPWTTSTLTLYPCSTNDKGPSHFRLAFDEPRGTSLANASSDPGMPSFVFVANPGWQADPGTILDPRTNWKALEPGFGSLGRASSAGDHRVSTGWPMNIPGSLTVCWWQRSAGPSGALAYAWGGSGGSVRCFTGGVAGNTIRYDGSPLGAFSASQDLRSPTGWKHVALVIDNQIGLATWYIDGFVDVSMSFPAGSHSASNSEFHIGWHQLAADAYDAFFDIDDFLMDGNALTQARIQAVMMGQQATHSTFDSGCAGVPGIPTITGNTSPLLGSSFAIQIGNAEPSSFGLLWVGVFVASGGYPVDLTFLGLPGCSFGVDPILAFGFPTDASGSANLAFPIPIAPALLHTHTYGQGLILSPGANLPGWSLTPTIAIHISDC